MTYLSTQIKIEEKDTPFWGELKDSLGSRWNSVLDSVKSTMRGELNPISAALSVYGNLAGSAIDFVTIMTKDITEIDSSDLAKLSGKIGSSLSDLLKVVAPETYEKIQNYGDEYIKEEDLQRFSREAELAYKIFQKENPTADKIIRNRLKDVENIGNILVVGGAGAAGKKVVTTGLGGVATARFASQVRARIDDIMKHVLKGDVKKGLDGKWKATGGHFLSKETKGIRIIGQREYFPKPHSDFYKAKIEVYSHKLADEQLAQKAVAEAKRKTFNIPDDKIGWKKKEKTSTMFPDSWDDAKIRMKIREAAENGLVKVSDPLDARRTAWRGYTNDNIPLQFAGFEVEGATPSVYANFDISTWK